MTRIIPIIFLLLSACVPPQYVEQTTTVTVQPAPCPERPHHGRNRR